MAEGKQVLIKLITKLPDELRVPETPIVSAYRSPAQTLSTSRGQNVTLAACLRACRPSQPPSSAWACLKSSTTSSHQVPAYRCGRNLARTATARQSHAVARARLSPARCTLHIADPPKPFDFIINGELLRKPLEAHLLQHGLSAVRGDTRSATAWQHTARRRMYLAHLPGTAPRRQTDRACKSLANARLGGDCAALQRSPSQHRTPLRASRPRYTLWQALWTKERIKAE